MIHSGAKQQNLAAEECQGKTRPRYEAFWDILPDAYHLYIYTVTAYNTNQSQSPAAFGSEVKQFGPSLSDRFMEENLLPPCTTFPQNYCHKTLRFLYFCYYFVVKKLI